MIICSTPSIGGFCYKGFETMYVTLSRNAFLSGHPSAYPLQTTLYHGRPGRGPLKGTLTDLGKNPIRGRVLAHKQNSRMGPSDRSGFAIMANVWTHRVETGPPPVNLPGPRRQALPNLSPRRPLDTCCAEYFNFTSPLLPVTIKLLTYVLPAEPCQCGPQIFYRSSIVFHAGRHSAQPISNGVSRSQEVPTVRDGLIFN
ncbi:hypothetical protein J6590_038550 [Homalodisca vitripennis]|nr:hypothetical protein J6590_038550 [Homalodisca vitripennis]